MLDDYLKKGKKMFFWITFSTKTKDRDEKEELGEVLLRERRN